MKFVTKTDNINIWKKWFAWYPIKISVDNGISEWIWLEFVDRYKHITYRKIEKIDLLNSVQWPRR